MRLFIKMINLVAAGKRDIERPPAELRNFKRPLNQIEYFLVNHHRPDTRHSVDFNYLRGRIPIRKKVVDALGFAQAGAQRPPGQRVVGGHGREGEVRAHQVSFAGVEARPGRAGYARGRQQ